MFSFLKKTEKVETVAQVVTPVLSFTDPMLDIRPQWKKRSAERVLSAPDMAALCIYRSYVKGEGKEGAVLRLKKSFRPITNPTKLANGADPSGAVKQSLYMLKYSSFTDWLPEADWKYLIEIGKEIAKDWK